MGLYLVAAQGTGTETDPRRPKYVELFGVPWTAMDYGAAPAFLVASSLPPSLEVTLNANVDFYTVPDLNSRITGTQIVGLSTRLEALGLPAEWLVPSLTWRQVLHAIGAVFLFAQRANVNIVNANLDQTFSQLPLAVRTRITDAAASFGFSTAGITGATPVRQVMRAVAIQWVAPIVLGDQTL